MNLLQLLKNKSKKSTRKSSQKVMATPATEHRITKELQNLRIMVTKSHITMTKSYITVTKGHNTLIKHTKNYQPLLIIINTKRLNMLLIMHHTNHHLQLSMHIQKHNIILIIFTKKHHIILIMKIKKHTGELHDVTHGARVATVAC